MKKLVLPIAIIASLLSIMGCSRISGTTDETESGVVAGVVRDTRGMGVHDALVTLHWQGEELRKEQSVRTFSDGSFELDEVPAGTYFLETKDLYKGEGNLQLVTVGSAKEVTALSVVRKMGAIEGRLDTVDVRSNRISSIGVLEIRRNVQILANGVFQIQNLPPFEDGYSLSAYSGLSKVATDLDNLPVAVNAGRTVNLFNKVDATDKVLVAYYLTREQAAQFSYKDGKISEFWSNWSDRDSIIMAPPQNSYAGRRPFNGPGDASMFVKAAGDAAGLYLYAEIVDDRWVEIPAGERGWICDAVDFYFDPNSSEFNAANVSETFQSDSRGMRINSLTQKSVQMQVWMGAVSAPEKFRLSAWSDQHQLWLSAVQSFEDARVKHNGLAFEVIQVAPNRKVQEWFIPWEVLGLAGEPLVGTRIAFSGGYNDIDNVENALNADNVKCLRWKEKDPFAPPDSARVFPDCWGDIEMGIGFPNL